MRSHYTTTGAGAASGSRRARRGALDGAPGGRDLRRRRAAARKRTLGPRVPAARVVEITLEDVDDAVQPRRQRGLILLHDLVRLLPFARRQMLARALERVAHDSLHRMVPSRGSARRRGPGCPSTTPPSRAATLRGRPRSRAGYRAEARW